MKRSLVLVFATLALAVPASAADVDPRALVLSPADVPAGFELEPAESGVRTNAAEAKDFPETRALFRRWKRVTGFQAVYERGQDEIETRSDLFRTAAGARALLLLTDREWLKSGISGQTRARTRIGHEGRVYGSPVNREFTLVVWRRGRVFSGLLGIGLPRSRTLSLARAQDRRIARALR